MNFQNSLFEVKYHQEFYSMLLTPGHCSVLAIDTSMKNRIVGIATARNEDDDATFLQQLFDCWNGKHPGYIMTLGVHSDYRRTGLGSELLKVHGAVCLSVVHALHTIAGVALHSVFSLSCARFSALMYNFIA